MVKKAKKQLTWRERESLEKELDAYIARNGDFRKGLAKDKEARAREILTLLGQKT